MCYSYGMASDNVTDQREDRIVVGVIRDLTARLEEYEQKNAANRETFQAAITAIVTNLRKDMHRAIAPIQLDQSDHRHTHDADRIERSNRQTETDRRFADLHRDIRRLEHLVILTLVLMAVGVAIVATRSLWPLT